MILRFRAIVYLLMAIISAVLEPMPVYAEKNPYDWAFIQLDYVRQEKVAQLERFTQKIHDLAKQASQDKMIHSFFKMNQQYYNVCESQKPTASLTKDIEKLRQHFNQYYIENYFGFYDILFINTDGSVFYTLRKESDTNININNSSVSLGILEKAISKRPDHEVFIDYYEYTPSSEPAAFFIEPMKKQGVLLGWIVLQCSINTLNSIFSATDDLGQTGETFLVNKNGLMLTESFFKGQSTILKKRLDDRNIKVKFAERKGHRVVTDYLGATALSSFEVFEYLGTNWLVVAKIDKDEITTNHYKQHHKYYEKMLLEHLRRIQTMPKFNTKDNHPPIGALRVDMDEFLKATDNESLETWGVSTCTALLAMVPEKFAYLAHISPKDKIYNGTGTNLVSQITKKIKGFDIYPFERINVIFVVIAPHLDGLGNIINRLISDGFLLSQIRVSFNSKARTASVIYNYSNNDLIIDWTMAQGNSNNITQNFNDTINVGRIVEKIMSDDT